MSRRILPAILACALFLNAPVFGQMYEGRRLVKASLLADTDAIVPGKPFTVGLLLKTAPNWHTYWQYGGDAGFATSIEWDLPPGFKAGAIQWPIPEKQTDEGDLQSYVYKDDVMLLVEITPPAKIDAKQIPIGGKASWLVCSKICVPGDANVSVVLPVAGENKTTNDDLFSKYRALLPVTNDKDFTFKWNVAKDSTELDFHTVMSQNGSPVSGQGPKFEFFPIPAPGMTVEHPSTTGNENGGHTTIKIDSGVPEQLSGVVVLENGGMRKGWFVPPVKAALPATGILPTSFSGGKVSMPIPPATSAEILRYLILGFFGGMLLNVMPCVLPVITLKIYGFMNQARQSRKRILHLGLAYCAGVFAWFLVLAVLIVTLGVGWSFQFQNQGFVGAMLVLCLLFGLNLIGVFEVVLPGGLNTKISGFASKEGLGGAFLHGLFATLMGSACTAPLLGPAVGFALSQPPAIIFSFFTTIAAGMAFPYFLLTLNPGWMRFLPKPGMWMVRIKQVMGVLVLATAVWFGYVLVRQITVKRDKFAPVLQTALKSGRTVFVDFTADWCINCKVNEKLVLKSEGVQEAFRKDDIYFLTADWSSGDPDITKILKQIGRAGVPAYVIYPAGSPDRPIVLSESLSQQVVLDGLKEAKEKPPVN